MAASRNNSRDPIRYAVVGLGHIAQVAVLPAFAHAAKNSRLAALVSEDPFKRREISDMYDVEQTYSYEQYDDCVNSGEVDAVYIALPNAMHRDFTVRAARAGVHVLCEKPMAVTEADCRAMIDAAAANNVKLMIAYRLHFEAANLQAIELVKQGKLGEPKLFNSVFNMQVKPGDIRLEPANKGGGPLYDIGIYCINAARYIFQDDPIEVMSFAGNTGDSRFGEVPESNACTLRFPHGRLASFMCSFGASDVSSYQVVGTEGDLRVEPAYDYAVRLGHALTIDGRTRRRTFAKRDHFAPELLYFSWCIQENREPEPSGLEGLADVRIIRALEESFQTGRAVPLPPFPNKPRPSLGQEIRRRPVSKPRLVHASAPNLDG